MGERARSTGHGASVGPAAAASSRARGAAPPVERARRLCTGARPAITGRSLSPGVVRRRSPDGERGDGSLGGGDSPPGGGAVAVFLGRRIVAAVSPTVSDASEECRLADCHQIERFTGVTECHARATECPSHQLSARRRLPSRRAGLLRCINKSPVDAHFGTCTPEDAGRSGDGRRAATDMVSRRGCCRAGLCTPPALAGHGWRRRGKNRFVAGNP